MPATLERVFEPVFEEPGIDRFGGPDAWDAYSEWREGQYAALIEGKTCLDCGNCVACGIEGHEGVGYCKEAGEFVSGSDYVKDNGCESFV